MAVGNVLALAANEVRFAFDPASPTGTLAELANISVRFPEYPAIPSGSIDRLAIDRDTTATGTSWTIDLDELEITGSDYTISASPASAPPAPAAAPATQPYVSDAPWAKEPLLFDFQVLKLSDNGFTSAGRTPSINNQGQIVATAVKANGRASLLAFSDVDDPEWMRCCPYSASSRESMIKARSSPLRAMAPPKRWPSTTPT
jgi:hypothetical protein